MAESTLSFSFSDLKSEVGYFLGYGSDSAEWSTSEETEIEKYVQSGIRQFYYPPAIEGVDTGYRWSWLTPVTTLTTVADDSDYDLPDDFGQIAGSITFAADSGYAPITVINEGLLRAMQADSDLTGHPRYAAIRFKTSDGSDGQRQEILFYPTPDAAYTLTYKYEAYNGKLTDANPYPLGGMACSELALESCLSVAEQRSEDKKGVHWDSFVRLLVSAIARDKKNGAKYYGPMGNTSEYTQTTRTRATSEITYKGETW